MPGWLVVNICWTLPRRAESPQARIWLRICRATASQRQWQRPTEAIGAAQKRAMRKIAARREPRPSRQGARRAATTARRRGHRSRRRRERAHPGAAMAAMVPSGRAVSSFTGPLFVAIFLLTSYHEWGDHHRSRRTLSFIEAWPLPGKAGR